MEPSRKDLEEHIGRRLIDKAQGKGGDDVVVNTGANEPMLSFEHNEVAEGDDQQGDPQIESPKEIALKTAGLPATSFTKIEKSLASLGFFTPSSRRLKDQKVKSMVFTREIDGKRVEVKADIIPSAMFGLPVTADQDKYLALQKIITDAMQVHGKIENPIRFKSADLLRLLNRNTKTGKNYKEVSEWLDVMMSTTIISHGVVYIAGEKKHAKDRFRVFDRAVSVGKEMSDGTIADANYVWLSSWQLDNINNNFLLPIDLETYQQLKNHIAKALVPLIQIWLFASHKIGSFEKRYDELCEILNVQKYKAPSLILRQFKPSLDELTMHEYLEKWRIERTVDGKAFKIVLFHGQKFHRDRRKRIEQKGQATNTSVVVAESELPETILPAHGKIEPDTKAKPTTPTTKRGKAATTTVQTATTDHKRDIGPDLVDQLATRGLMPSVAIKLLVET